jgi:hypothetical protein
MHFAFKLCQSQEVLLHVCSAVLVFLLLLFAAAAAAAAAMVCAALVAIVTRCQAATRAQNSVWCSSLRETLHLSLREDLT